MSTTPETEFDLEKHFLPAWAKESSQVNRYEKFEGAPERSRDRDRDRRDRPPRRFDVPGGGRPGARPGGRPAGPGRPAGGPGGPRPEGAGRGPGPRRGPGGPGGRGGRDQRGPRPAPAPAPAPLPDINLTFIPDDHGVDSLARQIRMTGRAYPLFEIAQMVLAKPERHSVSFAVKRKPDNSIIQPLFSCGLDETVWLSEDDAIRHVLDKHFAIFYQPEKTQVEPPKGVYTFVAQCGMSGAILGPPNYHDYQNQLRKLHAERFSRMPFEAFKARVRIVKDEAVVKKWIEEQSWKTEFVCLNVPEALKLPSREDVEKHFRQVHAPNIVKPVETVRLTGVQCRSLRDRELQRLVRTRWEEQQRFPLQVATVLSQQFASRGLQFFKVNKTVTHVAVARPHYLDLEATPISDGIRRIVEYITAHPKCAHKKLLEALAPAPAAAPAPTAEGSASDVPAAPADAAAQPTPAPAAHEPSPEMAAVMTDLHWLIHQGHVIEFANGVLEAAKKPLPKPPKPAKGPAQAGQAPTAEAPAEPVTPAEMVASEPPPADAPVADDSTATAPESAAATDSAPVDASSEPAGIAPNAAVENPPAPEPSAEPPKPETPM